MFATRVPHWLKVFLAGLAKEWFLAGMIGAVVLAKRSMKYVDRPLPPPAGFEHPAPSDDEGDHDTHAHGGGH